MSAQRITHDKIPAPASEPQPRSIQSLRRRRVILGAGGIATLIVAGGAVAAGQADHPKPPVALEISPST